MLTVSVYTTDMRMLTPFSWFHQEMLREGPRIWCLHLEAWKGDNSSHCRRWVMGRAPQYGRFKTTCGPSWGVPIYIFISWNELCMMPVCTVVSSSSPFWANWSSIKRLTTMKNVKWRSLRTFCVNRMDKRLAGTEAVHLCGNVTARRCERYVIHGTCFQKLTIAVGWH